uniref:Rab-GAP TBC domain-containing protein n=1 Tax=Angiostrongylus cantonensis TaxID=6313 RepID=A0A0K0D434_ANGCA
MFGALAAQSLAEPATAMTLSNLFQRFCKDNKRFRVLEALAQFDLLLINLCEILYRMRPLTYRNSFEQTQLQCSFRDQQLKMQRTLRMSRKLEHTTFAQVASNIAIFYDPDTKNSMSRRKRGVGHQFLCGLGPRAQWWFLVLANEKLIRNHVADKIQRRYSSDLCDGNGNADELILSAEVRNFKLFIDFLAHVFVKFHEPLRVVHVFCLLLIKRADAIEDNFRCIESNMPCDLALLVIHYAVLHYPGGALLTFMAIRLHFIEIGSVSKAYMRKPASSCTNRVMMTTERGFRAISE